MLKKIRSKATSTTLETEEKLLENFHNLLKQWTTSFNNVKAKRLLGPLGKPIFCSYHIYHHRLHHNQHHHHHCCHHQHCWRWRSWHFHPLALLIILPSSCVSFLFSQSPALDACLPFKHRHPRPLTPSVLSSLSYENIFFLSPHSLPLNTTQSSYMSQCAGIPPVPLVQCIHMAALVFMQKVKLDITHSASVVNVIWKRENSESKLTNLAIPINQPANRSFFHATLLPISTAFT